MKHILLRFFLIFACVAIPLHSHACWDDSYDDYYDYDDYDDDWYDDDWWNDDDFFGDDNTDDEFCFEIDDSDVKNGPTLDNVDVYYDGNDNDWWRTDYGDDDDYGNDDDWVDDYDDYGDDDQNNPDIPVVTPTESDKVYVKCKDGTLCLDLEKTKVYVISDKDKLVKELTNIPLGYKQVFPQASCIFAGLAFSYEVLTGSNVDHEADMLNKYGEIKGYDKLEDMMRNGSNAETVQWLLEYYYDLKPENSGSVLLYPTFELPNSSFSNFIDEGYVLMTNISIGKENEDSTDHNIVVVGYNDDGLICYDTLYGKVIELDASDFNQDYVIVLNKPNEEAFSGNKK